VQFNYGIGEEPTESDKKSSSYWYVVKDMFNQYKELLHI
jgi:hypothetical protein